MFPPIHPHVPFTPPPLPLHLPLPTATWCQADFLSALSKINASVGAKDITKHEQWLAQYGAV
jgi:hypothetical protein